MIPPGPDAHLDDPLASIEKDKNMKRGRKAGKGKNPLEGVAEFMKIQKELNSS